VWWAAESYRAERGSVRTWILSIVHNCGIDQLRTTANRRRVHDRVEATASTRIRARPFAQTWRNYQREQIREALRVLPPEQVKVLELAYYSGYTHKEIADLLDLSLGTVKGCMRLGLQKIRNYFDVSGREVPR
jgi:RNA polymerase sigma-70 factor, ECF subfamily